MLWKILLYDFSFFLCIFCARVCILFVFSLRRMVIRCPHGIVHSIKFNLGAESPSDFADLSWKHMPYICVYDFAQGLVAHTNLCVPNKDAFQPHEGRLAAPTEENIEAAQNRKLGVSSIAACKSRKSSHHWII